MKKGLLALVAALLLLFAHATAETKYLYRIEENGLFGFIDCEGKLVVKPQYSEASPFDAYGVAIVRLDNGQQALLDTAGQIIVAGDEIWCNEISYLIYPADGNEGMDTLYSPTTGTLIPFEGMIWDEPNTDPASTRVLVEWDGKYGYLDRRTGEVAIPLQYDAICYDWTKTSGPTGFTAYDFLVFHEGYAVVGTQNEGFWLIDENGDRVPLPGEPVTNVHEGKLNVRTEKGWQVCDVNGHLLSDAYDEIRSYHNGYCGALRWHYDEPDWKGSPGEFFILDEEGQEVYHGEPFIGHEKFCDFAVENGYFFISEASMGEYTEIFHLANGLLCTIPNKPVVFDPAREIMVVNSGDAYLLCHMDGTEIARLPAGVCLGDYYDDERVIPNFFRDGLWLLCWQNEAGQPRYGYLSEDGTWQIEPQFVAAESFRNGLAWCVTEDGHARYIDPKGRVIWQSKTPAQHIDTYVADWAGVSESIAFSNP